MKHQKNHPPKNKRSGTLIKIIVLTICAVGLFLRLIHLNWDAPFYFHPDERNIASAVTQLYFPQQMNPHFFAYGSFTVYIVYILGILTNIVSKHLNIFSVPFEQAIMLSRFLSVFYAMGTLVLLYFITKYLKGAALFVTFLAATSIGLIQFAHFGTVETALTFYSLLFFYFLIRFIDTSRLLFFIWIALALGVLCAIKVSSLTLLPLPIIAVLFLLKNKLRKKEVSLKSSVLILLSAGLTLTLTVIGIFLLTFPYAILDFNSFVNSMNYESSVSTGALRVFYTGDFVHAIPFWYQLVHIYPFILNPFITIMFIPTFIWLAFFSFRKRNIPFLFLLLTFSFLFIPQAVLFTKWTRYIIPTLPFIYIMLGVFITNFEWQPLRLKVTTQSALVIVSLVWGVAFVKTVYLTPDTRTAAAQFARQHISPNAPILSETYDLGILPFNQYFSHITLINFYDLESNPDVLSQLQHELQTDQYIILPSQRLLGSRLNHPRTFPDGYTFYHNLSTGKLGYHLIYQTPCDIFCKIVYLNNPVNGFEQTSSVFDRPTVFIYKKI